MGRVQIVFEVEQQLKRCRLVFKGKMIMDRE
jgi:hypothetical protein